MNILVLNAGSSSHKSALYALNDGPLPDAPPPPLWEADIQWPHGNDGAELTVRTSRQTEPTRKQLPASEGRAEGVAEMLRTLWEGEAAVLPGPEEIHAVGHRVVHGGRDYREAARLTPEVKEAISRLAALAPVHNPPAREAIDAVEGLLGPDIAQFAVFDTAFHSTLPDAAAVYPGPYDWFEQRGIRRYGFHGINHGYCAGRAAHLLGRPLEELRLITCHLGNGCSLAAIQGGRSIDTTMGFTPLEGLMMGSRSGSIDPGLLLYLLQHEGYTAERLDQTLNRESGLKGVSGISGDLRDITAAIERGEPRARLALDVYIHSLRRHIGAMLASLGGLDALVFTAGVGENSAAVREAACAPFAFAGVRLDPKRNAAPSREDRDIAAADSPVRILIIQAQEDWAIARECARLLG